MCQPNLSLSPLLQDSSMQSLLDVSRFVSAYITPQPPKEESLSLSSSSSPSSSAMVSVLYQKDIFALSGVYCGLAFRDLWETSLSLLETIYT